MEEGRGVLTFAIRRFWQYILDGELSGGGGEGDTNDFAVRERFGGYYAVNGYLKAAIWPARTPIH